MADVFEEMAFDEARQVMSQVCLQLGVELDWADLDCRTRTRIDRFGRIEKMDYRFWTIQSNMKYRKHLYSPTATAEKLRQAVEQWVADVKAWAARLDKDAGGKQG